MDRAHSIKNCYMKTWYFCITCGEDAMMLQWCDVECYQLTGISKGYEEEKDAVVP